jgi:hypothetical protein
LFAAGVLSVGLLFFIIRKRNFFKITGTIPNCLPLLISHIEIAKVLGRNGPILQLIGPTKSGKTVAMKTVLKDSDVVKLGGSQAINPDRLWALVCAALRVHVSQKHSTSSSTTNGTTTQASGKASIYAANFGLSREKSSDHQSGATKAIELVDDLFELATDALIRANKVLFLDDFHVVPSDQKLLIVASLKQGGRQRKALRSASPKYHLMQTSHLST